MELRNSFKIVLGMHMASRGSKRDSKKTAPLCFCASGESSKSLIKIASVAGLPVPKRVSRFSKNEKIEPGM